jgi:tRNA pseudouridine38-40 synthase
MPRYFAEIAYNGKNYHGWQLQENAVSVQAKLNEALKIYLREDIETMGCGRTDTGVNAKQFFAHFNTENPILDFKLFVYKLNKLLPSDIVIYNLFEVTNEAHARFDALTRTYEYYITKNKNVFNNLNYYYTNSINVDIINLALQELYSYQDFSCFSKSNTQVFTNNCKITYAKLEQVNESDFVFTITADRFLRNMVRAIVGTILEIGREKITIQNFKEIIESKNRSNAGFSVPADGLFLSKIEYPQHIFIPENTI